MNTFTPPTALGLSLTAAAFALMGGVPNTAHAVNANHSGTVCKNYNAAEATDIDYLTSGTRNLNANTRYVICPLVNSPTGSAINVYVDGYAASGRTISCTLYSYNYLGSYLGSQSFPSARTGKFDVYLSVPTNYWGGSSVLCALPPSGSGVIYDVDIVQ
jgi:hypothetical protein